MFFLSLGIWGSFYAILLQRVLKEEKQIKSEVDNEKEMLGKKKVCSWVFVFCFLQCGFSLKLYLFSFCRERY